MFITWFSIVEQISVDVINGVAVSLVGHSFGGVMPDRIRDTPKEYLAYEAIFNESVADYKK